MTSLGCFWKFTVFNITIKRHYIVAINDLGLPPFKKKTKKPTHQQLKVLNCYPIYNNFKFIYGCRIREKKNLQCNLMILTSFYILDRQINYLPHTGKVNLFAITPFLTLMNWFERELFWWFRSAGCHFCLVPWRIEPLLTSYLLHIFGMAETRSTCRQCKCFCCDSKMLEPKDLLSEIKLHIQ